MTPHEQVDHILDDCFFAVGQAVGCRKSIEYDAVVWWRSRYRQRFLHALTVLGNSWVKDRARVMAVGRYLGQRVIHHSAERATIDVECAVKASHDVELGCQMNAIREGLAPTPSV
jgi:hypothetical protein